MQSNAALFRLGAAPAVCWTVCPCLRLQMHRGGDSRPTCQTARALRLRFPRGAAARGLASPLRCAPCAYWRPQSALCDAHDLSRLRVHESALRPFLDRGILQKGRDCQGCYCFVRLSVQLLATAFYVLRGEDGQDAGSPTWTSGVCRGCCPSKKDSRTPT